MDNKRAIKKYVYSIRLTKEQRTLLKNNESIKTDLDKYIIQYLNSFLDDKK
jgi:hypothetical protein